MVPEMISLALLASLVMSGYCTLADGTDAIGQAPVDNASAAGNEGFHYTNEVGQDYEVPVPTASLADVPVAAPSTTPAGAFWIFTCGGVP